jgi:hypothetical protein
MLYTACHHAPSITVGYCWRTPEQRGELRRYDGVSDEWDGVGPATRRRQCGEVGGLRPGLRALVKPGHDPIDIDRRCGRDVLQVGFSSPRDLAHCSPNPRALRYYPCDPGSSRVVPGSI